MTCPVCKANVDSADMEAHEGWHAGLTDWAIDVLHRLAKVESQPTEGDDERPIDPPVG